MTLPKSALNIQGPDRLHLIVGMQGCHQRRELGAEAETLEVNGSGGRQQDGENDAANAPRQHETVGEGKPKFLVLAEESHRDHENIHQEEEPAIVGRVQGRGGERGAEQGMEHAPGLMTEEQDAIHAGKDRIPGKRLYVRDTVFEIAEAR